MTGSHKLYLEFFGLTDPPFRITPNTDYWFEGGQRGDLLATLVYAITHGEGLIKVVGEVGSGKTMLCRMLQQRLPDNIDTVYLGNPTLNPDEILAAILSDLGVTQSALGNRQLLLDQLNNALLSRHSSGRRVVAFVEEAQGMSLESLEFLRLLTNLETASDKLLQIVLFGQPELDQILGDQRIRQIKDRITLNLTLPPLSENETSHYLRSRLQIAGYRGPDLFSKDVVKRIARLSDGLSRRINILADKAMLAAFGNNTHNILPAHVNAAAKDADMASPRHAKARRGSWGWAMTGLIAGLSLLAFIAWRDIGAMTSRDSEARTVPVETAKPRVTIEPAPAVNEPLAVASEPVSPSSASVDWIKTAPADTFVIQILSARDETEAASLLQDMHDLLPQPVRGFQANTPRGPGWLVIAGEYPDRASAMGALAQLTSDIRAINPFLRTVGKIRATLAHEDPHEKPSSHS